MTPEITDPKFKAIAEEIRKDPENASFTKRGIDPLFYAGPECRIMIIGQAPAESLKKAELSGTTAVVTACAIGWESTAIPSTTRGN